MLNFGFSKVGLRRVVAFALPQNAASVRVIEKLSFKAIGTILHAGLDVYDKEPLPADHPLTKLDNVTLIPHLGYVVEDSYRHFYKGTIEDIEAWLDGKPINVLNPDALKK